MYICRHSEGVHTYLLKCCRGTCSSVGMLKRYMVRERLGTLGLADATQASQTRPLPLNLAPFGMHRTRTKRKVSNIW